MRELAIACTVLRRSLTHYWCEQKTHPSRVIHQSQLELVCVVTHHRLPKEILSSYLLPAAYGPQSARRPVPVSAHENQTKPETQNPSKPPTDVNPKPRAFLPSDQTARRQRSSPLHQHFAVALPVSFLHITASPDVFPTYVRRKALALLEFASLLPLRRTSIHYSSPSPSQLHWTRTGPGSASQDYKANSPFPSRTTTTTTSEYIYLSLPGTQQLLLGPSASPFLPGQSQSWRYVHICLALIF